MMTFMQTKVIMKIWGFAKTPGSQFIEIIHGNGSCSLGTCSHRMYCRNLRGLWFSTADLPIGLETQMMRVFFLKGGDPT